MYDIKPTKVNMTPQGYKLFKPASQQLFQVIEQLQNQQQPTFLIPTKFISKEAGIVGQFFDKFCNMQLKHKAVFRCFFCNSKFEAIHGTIKIMRHNTYNKKQKSILIYDATNSLQKLLEPIKTKKIFTLIPGISFVTNFENLTQSIHSKLFAGMIFHAQDPLEIEKSKQVFELCKNQNIISALSLCNNLENNHLFNRPFFNWGPNIFIYGESFTDNQIPFGCFCMSEKTFKPWDTVQDCLTHSSTYSGNLLALSYILKKIETLFTGNQIDDNQKFRTTVRRFSQFINPHAAIIYNSLSLAPNIQSAKSSWLKISSSRKKKKLVLDCLGNSGCNLRGHNPEDIKDVLQSHDSTHDYLSDLQDKLQSLTGLSHLIPATSGATSVEIALLIAQAASPNHQKILTFKNNFSGKTLGALSVAGYEGYKKNFYPLFSKVIFFDPFQKNAVKKLAKLITKENIKIAWFELLQGDSLKEIPEEIINFLKTLQSQKKIILGVDEILTGSFRTGKFLLSEYFQLNPDIITLSKGLSDMTFPFACTLISEDLYTKVESISPRVINNLTTYYANQFGAHIALHALSKAETENIPQNVLKVGKALKNELLEILPFTDIISEIRGRGLLLYLVPNEKKFPINVIGKNLFGFILSSYLIKKTNIFLLNCRLTPSLKMTLEEKDFLVRELHKGLQELSSLKIIGYTVTSFIRIYMLSCWRFITRLISKSFSNL